MRTFCVVRAADLRAAEAQTQKPRRPQNARSGILRSAQRAQRAAERLRVATTQCCVVMHLKTSLPPCPTRQTRHTLTAPRVCWKVAPRDAAAAAAPPVAVVVAPAAAGAAPTLPVAAAPCCAAAAAVTEPLPLVLIARVLACEAAFCASRSKRCVLDIVLATIHKQQRCVLV